MSAWCRIGVVTLRLEAAVVLSVIGIISVVPLFGVEFNLDAVDVFEDFDEGLADFLGLAGDLAAALLASGWGRAGVYPIVVLLLSHLCVYVSLPNRQTRANTVLCTFHSISVTEASRVFYQTRI